MTTETPAAVLPRACRGEHTSSCGDWMQGAAPSQKPSELYVLRTALGADPKTIRTHLVHYVLGLAAEHHRNEEKAPFRRSHGPEPARREPRWCRTARPQELWERLNVHR